MEAPYNIQDSQKDESHFKVYKRRWYILMIFSIYSFTQSAVWNTWGPISTTSEHAFNWGDATIAWMNNWGPVSYVLTGLFFPWLLQVKGLKWATLTSMLCVGVGTAFRVITSQPKTATVFIHIGQFINGIGGPISAGAIPAVSAAWFHPTERVTATALINSIGTFGTAVAFILGPALVPSYSSNKTSTSHKYLLFQNLYAEPSLQDVDNRTFCGWACFLFVVMLCYFPSKPPQPPCLSATVKRQHYWADIWSLRKKGGFMVVTQMFGISTGVFGGWVSVLNINLNTVSISEETAGWIGFYSTVAGCVASCIVGRFAGPFIRYLKVFILVVYSMATAAVLVFALMLINVIKPSLVGFYVTIVAVTAMINIVVPLMYELACELAYPTSEGSANGILTLCSSFWSLVFLAVFSFPRIGTMWMNWTMIGSTAICIPLLLVLKSRFTRLEVDEGVHVKGYAENVVVLSDEHTENDPLLAHNRLSSDSMTRTISVNPSQYGIHNSGYNSHLVSTNAEVHIPTSRIDGFTNPILSPAIIPPQAGLGLSNEHENGIQSPIISDAVITPQTNPHLTNAHEYGIYSPTLAAVNHPQTKSDLINPHEYGINNPTLAAVNHPQTKSDLINPHEYGIDNPTLAAVNHPQTKSDLINPHEYGIENPTLAAVNHPQSSLSPNNELEYGIHNPVIQDEAKLSHANAK